MQILFACYLDFVAFFYTCPEADIGLHTDGIQAVILCTVHKFGFFICYGRHTYLQNPEMSFPNIPQNCGTFDKYKEEEIVFQ